jgi:hypothetical protein
MGQGLSMDSMTLSLGTCILENDAKQLSWEPRTQPTAITSAAKCVWVSFPFQCLLETEEVKEEELTGGGTSAHRGKGPLCSWEEYMGGQHAVTADKDNGSGTVITRDGKTQMGGPLQVPVCGTGSLLDLQRGALWEPGRWCPSVLMHGYPGAGEGGVTGQLLRL